MGGSSSKTSPVLGVRKMAQAFVDGQIKQNPVVIFSKTYCPFCKIAKDVLTSVGVQFTLHELDERDDGSAIQDYLLSLTGDRTVPRVFIGGDCIGGSSETKKLQQEGKLVPLLQTAGAM